MQTAIIQGFPLSPQQEHLWLLQQLDNNPAYRSDCAILIAGNVDINRLELALQNVVNKYEILRTCFRCLPGMTIPVQVIANNKVILAKHNFSDGNFQEQEAKIEQMFQELSQLPFDLEQGLIFHASLVTLSLEKHLLLISLPAICADTLTLKNLLREIIYFYSAEYQDELSDEPLQYADFSEWQNQILEAEETEIGRKYWHQQNFSIIESLKLPYESPTLETQKFKPKSINATIASDLAQEIEIIAEKYQTSTSIFYLTCWLVLLWRLTQQSEIIIGTGVDGRKYEELKDALGLFAKYLPLHCQLEDNFRFSQILQQVHESVEEISKWQECFTWEQIASDVNGNLSFLPFGFDFEEDAKFYEGDVTFSIYQQYTCIECFQIKLYCKQKKDYIITEFHYDSNQFCTNDIENLAEQFHKLVESAVKNSEAAISELDILGDRTLHKLLFEFNQTDANYPQNKCIHQLVEEQAERTPNNIAVAFQDEQLTYAELNARANKVAHYLQKLGVGAEVLVGICVERSPEMLVGILGILKAGGAYVPIDPTYPQERLAFILEDTRTSILLTQHRLLDRLPVHNAQTICLDTNWDIAQESEENPTWKICAENLAYIIYTSGSTGKPKGVQVTHQNLVHSTTARLAYYQEITSFLLLSSFAFDSSVAGIFWTLCSGGILYLPEEGLQREVPKLIELIAQNHISHLLSLPSLYALILQQAKPEQLVSLRAVIVAGEACPTELVQHHLKLPTETSLFNEYGPTEATVWSSVYHCNSQHTKTQVPIGRPIANTQIYILDSHLHPVGVGVRGELYISGEGLARGYLNQPAMTAEKFIPNPFSKNLGMRLYNTGDLARYLSDGNIEFLGRIDNQVKIRGFRIELGEIEAALNQYLQVQQNVVVAREDIPGDRRLVAYVVPHQESTLTINELRNFLKERLPEYMVPSAFIILKELPLSPNGKVNRQALPAPEQVRSLIGFVSPRTPVEEMLAKIWTEILPVEKVGIHDNFFELGGHSLLTTQLLAKVRENFKIDVSLRSFLEIPTIAGLAENIDKVGSSEAYTTIEDIKAEAVLDPTILPETVGEFVTAPSCILLTGATGFLGAFLLYELLQQTKADIYCLVRCKNIDEGKKKLQNSLEAYGLWHESLSFRIIPVVGDLSKPLLGLEAEQFQLLARQIDVIYHNGAWVHHIYPYSILKQTNVQGTQEVLRLASQIKTKPVHFISSSGVFSSVGYSGEKLVREDNLDDNQLPSNGYSQSKYVAEKLVQIGSERGIPVCIYRPSRISGHSQTGVFNSNDFLYKLIIGCIQLGSVPDRDIRENIVPVDYVSKAIVSLSKKEESVNKAFHLVHPQILHSSMLIEHIHSLGYQLEQIPYEQWRENLLNVTKGSSTHPLYSLVPFFPARNSENKTSNSAFLKFDCQNTLNGLNGTSITCPAVDNQLLTTYFKHLIEKGFLDITPLKM